MIKNYDRVATALSTTKFPVRSLSDNSGKSQGIFLFSPTGEILEGWDADDARTLYYFAKEWIKVRIRSYREEA